MMTSIESRRPGAYVIGAWAVLIALTAASWVLGVKHGIAVLGLDISMIGILVLTFVKIALVGHSFMELRDAAPWLQRIFFGWCIATCVLLSAMYLSV